MRAALLPVKPGQRWLVRGSGAGLAVTACLSAAGRGVPITYLLTLAESAAGCFTVFLFLKPLGAVDMLTGVALFGVLVIHDDPGWTARAAEPAG